jgi:hypothetical protein
MRQIGFARMASPIPLALFALCCLGFSPGVAAQTAQASGLLIHQDTSDAKRTRLSAWVAQCDKFNPKEMKEEQKSLTCTLTPAIAGKPGPFGDPRAALVFSDPRVSRLCCSYDPATGRKWCWNCMQPGKDPGMKK